MATGRIGTTPALQVRWSKAPNTGTTSLSGLDDNSVSLVYSVGYEAVYRNGVLLSRGNDYTATNGTTVTLIDATLSGDIIEIFANQTVPLTDTYSKTVADAKYINNTLTTTTGDIIYASAANTPARLAIGSTDQVLKVSGGIPAWGAASSGLTLISRQSVSAASSVDFNGVFTSTYNSYLVIVEQLIASAVVGLSCQLKYSTSTVQTSGYYGATVKSVTEITYSATGSMNLADASISNGAGEFTNLKALFSPMGNDSGRGVVSGVCGAGANNKPVTFCGVSTTARVYTGFTMFPSTGTFTGTFSVYGLAKS